MQKVHKEQENTSAVQNMKQEIETNDDKKILTKLPYSEPVNTKSELQKIDSENYSFDDEYEVNNQSKQLWSKPAVQGYFEGQKTLQRKIPCFYCEVTFKTIGGLKNHCMWAHVGKKCVYCSICYSVFPQRPNLATHLEQQHKVSQAKLDAMIDSEMDADTLNQTKSDQNISVQEEKQQLQCEICELPFLTKQRLDIHVSTVHVKTKVIETNISPSDQIEAQNFDADAMNRMKKIRLEKDNSEENLSIKEISERIGSSNNIQSEEVEMVSESYFEEKNQNSRTDVSLNPELRQTNDQEPHANAMNRMKKIRLEKDNSEENLSIKEISERIGSSIDIQSEEVEMVSKKRYFDEKTQTFRSKVNFNTELGQKIDQEQQDCESNFEIDEFQLAKACIDFQPIVLLSKLDSVLKRPKLLK